MGVPQMVGATLQGLSAPTSGADHGTARVDLPSAPRECVREERGPECV